MISERLLYQIVWVGSRFTERNTRIIGSQLVAAATRTTCKIARDLLVRALVANHDIMCANEYLLSPSSESA